MASTRHRMSRKAGLAACLALCAFFPAAFAAAAQAGPAGRTVISLTGTLDLAMTDFERGSAPGENDPKWVRTRLEPDGLVHPIPHREGTAWVRFRFVLPEGPLPAEPAILITRPADGEEAFLNGRPVGGEGVVASYYQPVPAEPRLLTFPAPTLRAGANELLMKVLLTGKNIRIFDGPVMLGERAALAAEQKELLMPVIATESAFLSMFLFLIVFYGFLITKGVIRSEYILFTLFTAAYALSFLLDSNLLFHAGFASPWASHLEIILSSLLVPMMNALVTTITGGPAGPAYHILLAAGALFSLFDILLPPLIALRLLTTPRKIFLVIVAVYYLVLAIRSFIRRRDESLPVLLGVTAYIIGSRIELFWGLGMQDYAMGLFAL
jgi:hypothetical protein